MPCSVNKLYLIYLALLSGVLITVFFTFFVLAIVFFYWRRTVAVVRQIEVRQAATTAREVEAMHATAVAAQEAENTKVAATTAREAKAAQAAAAAT
jgi:uncharacterized membrane protein